MSGIVSSTFIDMRSPRMATTIAVGSPTAPDVTCCAPLGAGSLSDGEVAATARLFKALADPHRVRIVNLLATSPDPVCVCELTAPLGLSQPTVSHHLKRLVEVGLLEREQRGIWAYYGLNRATMARLAAAVDLQGADR
jgi:ArsR family transcriptional regulator, arsenate/arsenite/antimonite-responsive transcriptional repressor